MLAVLWLGLLGSLQAGADSPPRPDKAEAPVLMLPLADGVSMDDAVVSMELRANVLNFKLVAHQPLYKELQAMGLQSRRIEIFQFCDARIAKSIITYDKRFAAYLPCRIAMLEDQAGKAWLITMNLDPIIASAGLPPGLLAKAQRVRDTIREIMEAGAAGDL
jgi:uncharacterized protein (DUF302 family)